MDRLSRRVPLPEDGSLSVHTSLRNRRHGIEEEPFRLQICWQGGFRASIDFKYAGKEGSSPAGVPFSGFREVREGNSSDSFVGVRSVDLEI
ncbi:unnamed protein product [Linum trigynum]|uniref:Uncharacterized protein n=1 Tax=Linum trigynum TaxID=586398 RepID=A0AAV2F0V7_9ROSI